MFSNLDPSSHAKRVMYGRTLFFREKAENSAVSSHGYLDILAIYYACDPYDCMIAIALFWLTKKRLCYVKIQCCDISNCSYHDVGLRMAMIVDFTWYTLFPGRLLKL